MAINWKTYQYAPSSNDDKASWQRYLNGLRSSERAAEEARMAAIQKKEKEAFQAANEKALKEQKMASAVDAAWQAMPASARPKVTEATGQLGGPAGYPTAIAKALAPGQSVGGTKTMVTNDTGSFFVESTKGTPKISVATGGGTRTSDNATNITPLVNYTSATQTPIINQQLVDQAKNVQSLISSSLVNSIYSGQATQTTRPEVTITPITYNTPNGPAAITDSTIQINTPLSKPSANVSTQPLEKQEARYNANLEAEKNSKEVELARKAEEAKKAQDLKDAANKIKFDEQAKKTADLEAKRLADAKAAEEARFRAQQQFDYDSQIEAALRAAEGNSSLARRQFAANDARQKQMDAERLAKMQAKRGNPTGYAGGFAEKAIEGVASPTSPIKIPASAPQPMPKAAPEPANVVNSAFLPKIDGLQFGGN